MATVKDILRLGALAGLGLFLMGQPAQAGSCSPSNLASFSKLAKAVEDARSDEPGKLLAAWLLQSNRGGKCRFVFRIELLMPDGRIRAMNFDARSLEPVEIGDERDWAEAGAQGEGSESEGESDSASSSESSDDQNDDDKNDDNSGSSSDDSDDSDHSDDGGDDGGDGGDDGGDGGGDDSGEGGGDDGGDDGGSDSSGSGSGGDD